MALSRLSQDLLEFFGAFLQLIFPKSWAKTSPLAPITPWASRAEGDLELNPPILTKRYTTHRLQLGAFARTGCLHDGQPLWCCCLALFRPLPPQHSSRWLQKLSRGSQLWWGVFLSENKQPKEDRRRLFSGGRRGGGSVVAMGKSGVECSEY